MATYREILSKYKEVPCNYSHTGNYSVVITYDRSKQGDAKITEVGEDYVLIQDGEIYLHIVPLSLLKVDVYNR